MDDIRQESPNEGLILKIDKRLRPTPNKKFGTHVYGF